MPRTKVPDKEWKIVLARSGGTCAFPSCGRKLTEEGQGNGETAFLGDVAHIVADSRQGPRGDDEMSDADRDKHPNLVLLCPTCHDRVDKQPRTFSIPVLRRIKEDHEARVANAASPATIINVPALKSERILSSLLPITHLPMAVFAAPCGYGDRQDAVIKQHLKYPKDDAQLVRFLVREKTLFSFHDLRDPEGPFSPVIDVSKVEKYRADRFWATAEGHRRFITLLNRAMYRYTAKLGIKFDPTHQRFYFPVMKQGEERSVSYRPLNRQTENRQVAWEEKRRKTGEGKGFWWHLAAGLRFHRLADDEWSLSVRPERHLTTNGVIPLPPEKIGRKVTRLKAGMFNDKYLSEVNFWRDYLSGGSPRSPWTLEASLSWFRRIFSHSMFRGPAFRATRSSSGTRNMKKTSSRSRNSSRSPKGKTTSTGTTRTPAPLMPTQVIPTKLLPLTLSTPTTSAEWLNEPDLVFASGKLATDPKVGIPLYGPRSLGTSRHKKEIHVGFIGTSETVEKARAFYERCSAGIDGSSDCHPFPGCTPDAGFRCTLATNLSEVIRQHEYDQILNARRKREKFETLLGLLEQKMYLITERDHPLDYVVVSLPDELFRKCRSVEYADKGIGRVYRNLRRSFKAAAMRFDMPTQILLERTIDTFGTDKTTVPPAQIAWNLFTGMYFKVEGLPWGPSGLTAGTCYIGISFFRPLGDSSSLRTSVVQAFDENGQGLVLRGHKFMWDEEKYGKSPHLPADQAKQLIDMVLEQYKLENGGRLPRRVVIHKTSRFEPDEHDGFREALRQVSEIDLVSLTPISDVRLLRIGRYPPLRGTVFHAGDVSYCYTSGYLLGRGYPHGHVPSALQIADHKGDTARTELLREVLVLTKMNWNSANMFGLMPITLRFSRLVADVLREVPETVVPKAKYKFYM